MQHRKGICDRKNPAAVALLQENKKKFAVDHLEIIEGTAPEALEALPVPTHAFIGGSAGNLKEILNCSCGRIRTSAWY